MYAVIRRYVGNETLADRLAARADEIRSVISGIAGFQAFYLIRCPDGTASVTVCDDREGADESSRLARAWIVENMPDAANRAPEVTGGDVVIHL